MGVQDANETGEAIDSLGTVAQFEPQGRFILDITLTGTASATYEVEVANNRSDSWESSVTYSSVTSIADTLEGAASKVRLQITTAASGGSTADYYIGCGD